MNDYMYICTYTSFLMDFANAIHYTSVLCTHNELCNNEVKNVDN